MKILVNKIQDENAKEKFNAAVTSLKRDIHNLSSGLRVDALNRTWNQFVLSYNRMISLLYELDRKYGQFQVPSPDYYDQIPVGQLTSYENFTASINLVYATVSKIKEFNLPVLQVEKASAELTANFNSFTRSYVATANKESATIKTQQRDREGHVTSFQNYIAKANSYATAEQREIAQEYMESVYEGDLTTTATEGAETLGDILTAIEDTIEAVNNTGNRNDETTSNLENAKSELEDLIDKTNKAAQGYNEARDNLVEAGNAYNQAVDVLQETKDNLQRAADELYEEVEPSGWMVDMNPDGSVLVTDRTGQTTVYDTSSGEIKTTTGKTYAYDETTGKWTNVDDPSDVASDEMGSVYDKMKGLSDANALADEALEAEKKAKENLDKAQETFNSAETEYKEAKDALDTATGDTTTESTTE